MYSLTPNDQDSVIQQQRAMALRRKEMIERLRFSEGLDASLAKVPTEIARPHDAIPQVFARRLDDMEPSVVGDETVLDYETIAKFWDLAFDTSKLSLADFEWYRIVVAWRITRALAVLLSICQPDELLSEAMARRMIDNTRNLWDEYTGPPVSTSGVRGWLDQIPYEAAKRNLGLAIPDIPEGGVDASTGLVRPEYTPRADVRLLAWLDIIGAIADKLGIEAGSREYPNLGTYGLYGVLEPGLCRLLWPSRFDMLHFEAKMTHDTLEMLQQSGGQRSARKKLKERYGFHNDECAALISAAGREAAAQTGTESTEQSRSLLVLRLEEIIDRAKTSMDLKTELNALKTLAMVQGVTRAEPEDEKKAYERAISKIAGGRRQVVIGTTGTAVDNED